jgi:hypothetical protein
LKPRFEKMKLNDIRRSHVNEYVSALREDYAAGTVSLTLSVLHDP